MAMKENIIELLKGDSLDSYLQGIECLEESIDTDNLSDSDLDQEIIERACAIFVLEKWAEQQDYSDTLQKIIDTLPDYSPYLAHDEIGDHIRGIALFINGLAEGRKDVSGFIYPSYSGYLMSMTAAEEIKDFFNSQNNTGAAEFFTQVATFFERINSAQFGIANVITKIKIWNDSMIAGFYHILTSSDYSIQSWMLGSLYQVVELTVIKEQVFNKYIAVLKNVQAKYAGESDSEKVKQVNLLLEMVIVRSKGK